MTRRTRSPSGRSGLAYDRRHQIPLLLAKGWRGSIELRDRLLKLADPLHAPDSRQFDRDLVERTLLLAFPGDPNVAAWAAERVRRERYPFIGMGSRPGEAWGLVKASFAGQSEVLDAIDEWLSRERPLEMDLTGAALVGCTATAKAKLLEAVADGKHFIHWPVSALLEGWGMDDADVAERLTKLVDETPSRLVLIAHLLPRIVSRRGQCYELLMSMLRDLECRRTDFVLSGLHALGALAGNDEALDLALAHLRQERQGTIDSIAPRIIRYFPADRRVRQVALDELARPFGDCDAVAKTFGDDPELRALVLAHLSPLPARLREVVVQSLSDRPIDDSFATRQLSLYGLEYDPEIKTKASIAYHRRLHRSGSDLGDAIATLAGDIRSYLPDQEERRQAALCGLIALGRLDVFENAEETIGKKRRPMVVGIDDFQRLNYAALHFIAEHWEMLRSVFRGALETRIIGHLMSRDDPPWRAMSAVARAYPYVAKELLAAIESDRPPELAPGILRFVADVRPKSRLLREKCMEVLRRDRKRQSGHDDSTPVAAELLAEHFGGDPTILREINELIPDDLWPPSATYGPLLAMSDGWPGSDEFRKRVESIKGTAVRWDLWFAIESTSSGSEGAVVHALEHFVSQGPVVDEGTKRRVFRFCVRALTLQSKSFQLLVDRYLHQKLGPLRASAPSLLVASRGLGLLGRHHLLSDLRQELSNETEPTVGYDLLSDQDRSRALGLFDVLVDQGV